MSKSDGVKDIVSWMETKIKEQQKVVDEAEKNRSTLQEVGDYYDRIREEERIKLSVMRSWKVSTEKYMKKLRHNGE